MKALVLTEYRELELQDVPVPELGPEDVRVRVKACGICGSDVHGFDGSSGRRIPPLIMGHEASGQIAEVGSQVKNLREGDRVTFDSMVSCGRCHFCRRGDVNLCEDRRVLGVSCAEYRQHGAFAEYVVVPQRIVYRLSDELSFEHASLVEPVSVAVHAVNRTPIALGDTAVVVGTGMVGLLVVHALRLAGCGRIFAVDLDDYKLKLARSFGADEGFNPKSRDVPAAVSERTEGRGVDLAVEVVGATETLATALAVVRKGGVLTMVGNLTPTVDFPMQNVVTREITLIGSCGSSGEYPACIELLARGAFNVGELISHVAPLSEGPSWFERLYRQEPKLIKVLLTP